jgi:hypothetical protein
MALGIHLLDHSTDYAVYILHNLIVPEAQDFVALHLKILCSCLIVLLLLKMLAAVKFNGKPGFGEQKSGT